MSTYNYSLLVTCSFLCCIVSAILFLRRCSSDLPLPPGPKRLPLIGNLLQYPQRDEHTTFKKWGDQYGEICSVTVMGKTVVVLNSVNAMNELLEKRATLYSGRPKLVMAGELCGFDYTVTLTHDKEKHRKQRRLFNTGLGNRATKELDPTQLVESRKLMTRLVETPEHFENHVLRAVVAVVMMASYAYQVDSNDDHYIDLGKRVLDHFGRATQAGAYLVEFFPFLRFIPPWFPGGSFRRDAEAWKADWFELTERPFDWVKANMAAGTAKPSFVSTLLKIPEGTHDPEEEEDLKWTAGTMYAGGSDTSATVIMTFFIALMLNPNVQAKAHTEVDRVIGRDRLPTFADKDNLPYCYAIVKECLRWRPVAPTAVVHAAREEDTYNGYRIPKGALVYGNIWATTRDPEIYPHPEDFVPERFLCADGKTPRNPDGVPAIVTFAFGFGRRVCPGAALAEATVFIAVVNVLWSFDISMPLGTDGKAVEPDTEYLNGLVSHPKPFKCDIRPRAEDVVKMLKESLETD